MGLLKTFGKVVRLPLALIPKDAILRVKMGVARGMKWRVGSGIHACWLGTYERNKQQVLRHFVKPGMVVYDIGAQAGFYTLLLSRLVGKNGRVFAFEPFAQNVVNLLRHVDLNKLQNVTVIQAAVGARMEMTGFTVGSGVYQNRVVGSCESVLSVPQIDLDTLIGNGTLPAPALVKIDVEGAESGVLQGGVKMLTGAKPIVFLATHGTEQSEMCQTQLRELSYRLFGLDKSQKPPAKDASEFVAVSE